MAVVTYKGAELDVNTDLTGNIVVSSITRLDGGGFVVVWTQDGEGKAQIFDATGAKVGGEVIIHTIASNESFDPSVATVSGGGFLVAWGNASPVQAVAQIFSATGTKVGGEFQLPNPPTGNHGQPAVTGLAGNAVVAVWTENSRSPDDTSGSGVRGQIFTANGDRVGAEFQVNSSTAGFQYNPTVSGLANGGFVASWLDQGASNVTKLQAFDASGHKVGGEILINTHELEPKVAALQSGGFVVTWLSNGVMAKIFASDGTAAGSAFRVDPGDGSVRQGVTITTLDDGGVLVAWSEFVGDYDEKSKATIKAQIIDKNGEKVGSTFQLDQDPSGPQALQVVTNLGSGSFAGAWLDADRGISAQIYSIDPHATSGGAGDHIILGGINDHLLVGGPDTDQISGSAGDDVLMGGTGVNFLDGGAGNDTASYADATSGVKILLSQTKQQFTESRIDQLIRIENLSGSGFADHLSGDAGVNVLDGGAGNDTLQANAGADTLKGGDGADLLNGGTGADLMIGGAGDDIYLVDNALDIVQETSDGGNDTVKSSVSYALGVGGSVEKLMLTGVANINGVGNELGNSIVGNNGANHLLGLNGDDVLLGRDGDDMLEGGAGDDQLGGGSGNDVLIGGLGSDHLTGGAGADIFRFDVLETAANRDVIRGFVAGEDHIQIVRSAFAAFVGDAAGALDPSHLALGASATTAGQHLVYDQTVGILYYDADGVGGVEQVEIALIANKPALTASDFLLF